MISPGRYSCSIPDSVHETALGFFDGILMITRLPLASANVSTCFTKNCGTVPFILVLYGSSSNRTRMTFNLRSVSFSLVHPNTGLLNVSLSTSFA